MYTMNTPQLFTATVYGRVPNLIFKTQLYHLLEPQGAIIAIKCDHGAKYQEGHEPLPKRPRVCKSTRKHRKKLTTSDKFNSFGSCLIFKVLTTKVYNIMVFINGCIQVAGVLKEDFQDAQEPIDIVLKYLGAVLDCEYTLTDVRPELMNYKCQYDKRISLADLSPPATFKEFTVTFTDYNPERHTAYIIKVSLGGLNATIKLFESGKCNILGVKDSAIIAPLIVNLNSYLRQGDVTYMLQDEL